MTDRPINGRTGGDTSDESLCIISIVDDPLSVLCMVSSGLDLPNLSNYYLVEFLLARGTIEGMVATGKEEWGWGGWRRDV